MHVIAGLENGGAERSLERIVSGTREGSPYRHCVVSLTTLGVIGRELRSKGVNVRALEMRSLLGAPAAIWRLRRMMRAETPDIVQTWMYHADLLAGIASRFSSNPRVIWGIRATDMMRGTSRLTGIIRRVCAILSSSVPQVIVCNAEASRRAHEAIGYDSSRMTVIPNGFAIRPSPVSASEKRIFLQQFGWSEQNVVIGCVGRFNYYKDQDNFVRASKLVGERYREARFLMVGRGLDSTNHELSSWVAATGFPERFTLLGERSDVSTCLAAMDVFCLSSRSEGFPNVVGEAMAMAIPCVVTDAGDSALIVGDTGIVVPKENAAALADGLCRLLGMSRLARESLGSRARDRISESFSLDVTRRRFETIYARLVAGEVPLQ